MLLAIRHGLGNLFNFDGRDARQAFWYYVLFVYLATVAVTVLFIVPVIVQGFIAGIRQGIAASEADDPAAAEAAAQTMVEGMLVDTVSTGLWIGIVTGALTLALLAASLVRRLHDSDLSGRWALIPGGLQALNLLLAPTLMHRMIEAFGALGPDDPTVGIRALQSSFGLSSLLGWAAIIAVIGLGIRKSTPGPNRYGETPFVA